MKAGKGDALGQEQGLFCILFVAAWTKRMAFGGTRPAGLDFVSKTLKCFPLVLKHWMTGSRPRAAQTFTRPKVWIKRRPCSLAFGFPTQQPSKAREQNSPAAQTVPRLFRLVRSLLRLRHKGRQSQRLGANAWGLGRSGQ